MGWWEKLRFCFAFTFHFLRNVERNLCQAPDTQWSGPTHQTGRTCKAVSFPLIQDTASTQQRNLCFSSASSTFNSPVRTTFISLSGAQQCYDRTDGAPQTWDARELFGWYACEPWSVLFLIYSLTILYMYIIYLNQLYWQRWDAGVYFLCLKESNPWDNECVALLRKGNEKSFVPNACTHYGVKQMSDLLSQRHFNQ